MSRRLDPWIGRPDPRPRNGSRRRGTNPRALGTNPRALGTNPSAGADADRARVRRLLDHAYEIVSAFGRFVCDDCADAHYWHGAECSCRIITTREAYRITRLARAAKAGGNIGSPYYLTMITEILREHDP